MWSLGKRHFLCVFFVHFYAQSLYSIGQCRFAECKECIINGKHIVDAFLQKKFNNHIKIFRYAKLLFLEKFSMISEE